MVVSIQLVRWLSIANDKNQFGRLHMRIMELLTERDISKTRICKDLDIPRSNFNKYCRDQFQRIDANLVCKICDYLDIEVGELIVRVK